MPKVRRKVEDLPGFCGWRYLLELTDRSMETEYYASQKAKSKVKELGINDIDSLIQEMRERDRALISTSFCTGGRISEVLMLRKENFSIDKQKGALLVRDMPLIKRYKKITTKLDVVKVEGDNDFIAPTPKHKWSHELGAWIRPRWVTEPVIKTRLEFPIPLWEPLVEFILDWLDSVEDWLFESHREAKRSSEEEQPGVGLWMEERFGIKHRKWISPSWAYRIVRNLSWGNKILGRKGVWNHWFRSMRSSQLRSEYEFDEDHINRFLGWEPPRSGTYNIYARISTDDLLKHMKRENLRV